MLHELTIKAPCKVNLSLDVVGKQENGYHLLKTVMQTVDLADTLTITKTSEGNIALTCTDITLPTDERNLAYKAAADFFSHTKIPLTGLHIHIEKHIPMQAGLGGGSADAAAVLVGLNHLFEANLSQKELCLIGERIGADVPFCIVGGTVLAEGIGEIFTVLPSLSDCSIVIAKPKVGVSTKDCFHRIDTLGSVHTPNTAAMVGAIDRGSLADIGANMVNVMEEAAQLEELAEYKKMMLQSGALGAVMTGSGSAVIGLFDGNIKAEHCAEVFHGVAQSVFVTKPVSYGASLKDEME